MAGSWGSARSQAMTGTVPTCYPMSGLPKIIYVKNSAEAYGDFCWNQRANHNQRILIFFVKLKACWLRGGCALRFF